MHGRAFTSWRAPADPPAATMRLAGVVLLSATLACAGAGAIASQSPSPSAEPVVREGTFELHGESRSYRVFVPPTPNVAGAPLVVMLHGCTQSAVDAAAGTRLDAAAAEFGFAVLYPEQAATYHPQRCWRWYDPAHQQRDVGEPAAIATLAQQVAGELGVDRSRIYLAGISAGGIMAVTTALAYPEVFTAVASHSGAAFGAARDVPGALAQMRDGAPDLGAAEQAALRLMGDRARFIPLMIVHGDSDLVVRAQNARDLLAQWRTLASATGVRLDDGDSARVEKNGRHALRRTFTRDGTPALELLLVEGLGHAWSGGSADGSYTDPRGPDATREIMTFLLVQRRP